MIGGWASIVRGLPNRGAGEPFRRSAERPQPADAGAGFTFGSASPGLPGQPLDCGSRPDPIQGGIGRARPPRGRSGESPAPPACGMPGTVRGVLTRESSEGLSPRRAYDFPRGGRVFRVAALLLLGASAAGTQETTSDAAATAALRKLADRLKEARTLSAKVVQSRLTGLLDKPLTSSGRMYYRRDPARLVFQLSQPRMAEIHMDRTSYQVYRPDEKRLERTDFGGEDIPARILMVFDPKADEIEKAFGIHGGERKDGHLEVRLEPSDEKVRTRLQRVLLTIVEADGTLRRISYVDGEGDEVRFDLSDLAINPDLAPGLFALQVPEGTRVLRHTAKPDK